MRGQRHAPAASYPGKDPVPIVQEAGWASGPVWTSAENLALTGIQSPDHPALRQSLYRLSYQPTWRWICVTNFFVCPRTSTGCPIFTVSDSDIVSVVSSVSVPYECVSVCVSTWYDIANNETYRLLCDATVTWQAALISLSIATAENFKRNSHQFFCSKKECAFSLLHKQKACKTVRYLTTGYIITVIYSKQSN